jgi:hypothetical protein
MIVSKGSPIWGTVIFGVLLLLLIVYPWELTGKIIIGLLLFGVAVWCLRAVKIYAQNESRSLLEAKRREYETQLILTLNHHRHDWMNEVQVLFGYIKLKKYDNLQGYVEKIMMKIQQESGISKLGVPALVAYLLSFRTMTNEMKLEVEMDQDVRLDELPLDKELASSLIISLLEAFKAHVLPSMDGGNSLSLELAAEEDHLLIDCVYRGEYSVKELQQALDRSVFHRGGEIRIIQTDFSDRKAIVTIGVPFHM